MNVSNRKCIWYLGLRSLRANRTRNLAAVLAFALVLLTAPLLRSVLEGMLWFLTYRFTLLPVLAVLPVFAALGVVIPILSGRADQKRSLVERLRQE